MIEQKVAHTINDALQFNWYGYTAKAVTRQVLTVTVTECTAPTDQSKLIYT